MKGQLSAEMLILIAVVIAVVAIAATSLIGTAKKSGEQVGEQGDAMLNRAEAAMKGGPGDVCADDSDCRSNSCDSQGAAATYSCN